MINVDLTPIDLLTDCVPKMIHCEIEVATERLKCQRKISARTSICF